jgi:histidine ammonia-lyase
MNANTRHVLAIELLAAAQGIDLRRPLTSNDVLERAHATVREVAARWDQDRYFRPDLEAVAGLIEAGHLGSWVRV